MTVASCGISNSRPSRSCLTDYRYGMIARCSKKKPDEIDIGSAIVLSDANIGIAEGVSDSKES
jgi:hypothetical protein